MKIVIDARIIDSSTGVYVQRLLHFLHEVDTKNDYVVVAPLKTIDMWRDRYPHFDWQIADQPPYTFAEQFSFAWQLYRLKADLVHFTMPQQPFLYFKPAVTTIHDTTLVRFDNIDINPVIYKIRKAIFSVLLRVVSRRSKAVLVPTEFVRRDLIDYVGDKNHDKYVVTLEAGDPVNAEPEIVKALDGERYLAFVGNAFPYKNILRTIKAYAKLKPLYPDLHLALGGKKDYFYSELEAYVSEHDIPDVHFLGFISDGEKRWLYQNAQAMVTASLSEGFCIPLLEAMYEGCPVIASNASCLPEVAGDAALYFDPHSTDDLVEKITTLLEDKKLRDELVKKGSARVKEFSWKRMAEQTLDTYEQALPTQE